MNRFGFFIALIGLVGLVMVWASGVDLVYSRVGFGMIILGGALGLLALGSLIETRQEARYPVILACLIGAGYFVWRALWADQWDWPFLMSFKFCFLSSSIIWSLSLT